MIRSRLVPPLGGLFGDGRYIGLASSHLLHCLNKNMGNEQVADEFALATEDAGETLVFEDERCQVPQSVPIAGVRVVEAGGSDLRARGAERPRPPCS